MFWVTNSQSVEHTIFNLHTLKLHYILVYKYNSFYATHIMLQFVRWQLNFRLVPHQQRFPLGCNGDFLVHVHVFNARVAACNYERCRWIEPKVVRFSRPFVCIHILLSDRHTATYTSLLLNANFYCVAPPPHPQRMTQFACPKKRINTCTFLYNNVYYNICVCMCGLAGPINKSRTICARLPALRMRAHCTTRLVVHDKLPIDPQPSLLGARMVGSWLSHVSQIPN